MMSEYGLIVKELPADIIVTPKVIGPPTLTKIPLYISCPHPSSEEDSMLDDAIIVYDAPDEALVSQLEVTSTKYKNYVNRKGVARNDRRVTFSVVSMEGSASIVERAHERGDDRVNANDYLLQTFCVSTTSTGLSAQPVTLWRVRREFRGQRNTKIDVAWSLSLPSLNETNALLSRVSYEDDEEVLPEKEKARADALVKAEIDRKRIAESYKTSQYNDCQETSQAILKKARKEEHHRGGITYPPPISQQQNTESALETSVASIVANYRGRSGVEYKNVLKEIMKSLPEFAAIKASTTEQQKKWYATTTSLIKEKLKNNGVVQKGSMLDF